MRLFVSTGVALLAFTVAAGAQDSTVRSRSNVKADDAQVVAMTGCLRQDQATRAYLLVGKVTAAGENVRTEEKTKTDIDSDKATVRSRTTTKADDGAVAADGGGSVYALVPRAGVDLASQVGHRVQLSAIIVEPGKGDADVRIDDKTRVDQENGRDTSSRSKTKVELPRGAIGQYTVVSVKSAGGTCSAY